MLNQILKGKLSKDVNTELLRINYTQFQQLDDLFFWFGSPIKAQPEASYLEKYISKNMGVLFNSADIIFKPKVKEEIEREGINEFTNIHSNIMLDSGGFIFQQKDRISIDVHNLIEFYKKAKPKHAVALDHPLNPSLNYSKNYKRRQKSLENLEIMVKANLESNLIPVIHGYSFTQLRNFSRKVKAIFRDNYNEEPKWIGLGSMVPLLRLAKGSGMVPSDYIRTQLSSTEFLFASIAYMKKLFPKSNLHVFGIGGTTTMQLAYAAGANSIDSVGWRLKAAHGAIQMSGVSDRFLSPRKNTSRKVLEDEYQNGFKNCKCGIKPHSMEQLDNSFTLRAIHNAFIYSKEFQRIINTLPITDKNVHEMYNHLKSSPLKKFIPFIIQLRNGYFRDCKIS